MNLASLASQIGDLTTAEKALTDAVAADKTGVTAHVALARLYLMQRNVTKARAIAEEIMSRDQGPDGLMIMAGVEQMSGNTSAARELVARAQAMKYRRQPSN